MKTLVVIGGVALIFFVAPLIGVVCGAFSGWVVGLFFEHTVLSFLSKIGIEGLKMWEIGASLGFLGSFFKSYSVKA